MASALRLNKNTLQKSVRWNDVDSLKGHKLGSEEIERTASWRVLYLLITSSVLFAVLFISIVDLQVVHGRDNDERSKMNRLEEHVIQPDRGIIYDRNGKKLATNVPSFDIVLDPRNVEEEKLQEVYENLENIIGVSAQESESKYEDAVKAADGAKGLVRKVLLAQDVSRDDVLKVRSHHDELEGIWIDYSSKRKYVGGKELSHIMGYTGESYQELIESDEDISVGDIVGIEGLEYYYDKELRGTKGTRIVEIDASQKVIGEYVNIGSEPVPGDNLYLSIDYDSQKKLYQILKEGVKEYGATGAAGVLMDVKTGEVWASVSYPGYDNNLFVGGISTKEYNKLTSDKKLPLFNRVISAQEPPGSMYKTIVASAALQEKAITKDTVFNSVGVLYTPAGAYLCQEYHRYSYGPLNLIGGIAKSSNIYFFHTMDEMGIKNFLPYAEFFGIAQKTGIDLPGEATGRIHSPENKEKYSETMPWIDPVWYPGDDCNAAIGQGLTTTTPLQVVNWITAIANGGKIVEPHLAKKFVSSDPTISEEDRTEEIGTEVLRSGKVSKSNLALVREGMRNSASGPLSVIVPFRYTKVNVAGKTGTAEFGVKDESGTYVKTHAWVTGFFPYEKPRFSFVVFLEGGGESNNSAMLAAEFIDWFADNKL